MPLKRWLVLGALVVTCAGQAQTVINCSNFTTTGACGVSTSGGAETFWLGDGASLPSSPGPVSLIASGSTHTPGALLSQAQENVQAFNLTYTFVPNGQNISFFATNTNNNPGFNAPIFGGGAGCEGGFYQAFGSTAPPNNMFAVQLDSYASLTAGGSSFTYSGTQWYQSAQSPCNPNDSGPDYWGTNKTSTSPVSLNSPSSSQGSTTGDTYSVNIVYDGSNLTENLYDMTAGGTCTPTSSATCFTHTWTNVFIPSIVGATSAYVGIIGATGETVAYNLPLNSFVYTVETPTGTPTTVAYNANSTTNNGTVSAASPTYNVAPGSYSSAQTVTISASSGNYVCYEVVTSGSPTYYPQPTNNNTSSNSNLACNKGTLYSGPVTISSTATLYAAAGLNLGGGPPSPLTAATYTITGGGPASIPTFSPVAGTYVGSLTATISTTSSGAVICYNTTGSPATNGASGCATGTLYAGPITVSSSETLYAVAGGTGYSDSSVGSVSYVVSSSPPAVISGKAVITGKTVVQ
jgi:Chitobiase/beta-hexosaminidase C-terminal domain